MNKDTGISTHARAGIAGVLLAVVLAGAVRGDVVDSVVGAGTTVERGTVTNLPIPRFVSLKVDEGNVRRGPSKTHRIDWVFRRRNMPLEITGEYGNWRRVRDRDGAGGWVHYSLLSGKRTVIVQQDMLPLMSRPDSGATVRARVETGVVARLEECEAGWCRIRAERYRGWARQSALWGVNPTGDEE